MRDSAGVTIVESIEGLWAEGEGWTISGEPALTIGVDEGPEEYSLFQVRAALQLPDGRIVIANNGSDELRYYDSSGTFLYSVGNDGYGPGEFKMMWGMWLVSDTLVISDWGQDRVSVFSADGVYGRTAMLHREPGSFAPTAVGAFSDGSLLGSTHVVDPQTTSDEGFHFSRTYASYVRYSRDGAALDSLGVFLFTEGVSETLETETNPQLNRASSRTIMAFAPFGRVGQTIAAGDFLYHGSGDTYEIQVFSKDGALQRIIRRPMPNSPVTEGDKELFRDDWLEDGGDWARRRVHELEYPETKPAYGGVKVDALGNVWVAEYTIRSKDRGGNWTVFDTDGQMLGIVEVPRGGGITDIGDDYLIGVWRTELDVEQVRLYRLFKNRG